MEMRRPTPHSVAYQWWRDALAGRNPPIHEGEPQCGYFIYRGSRRWEGRWVYPEPKPARIWIDAEYDVAGELSTDETLRAAVDGIDADPMDIWVWVCQRPITEEEYESMLFEKELLNGTL